MFYCNNGILDVKKEFVNEVIKAFSNTSLKDKVSQDNVEETDPGIAMFFIEEAYGDIEDGLRLATRQLKKEGILVNGTIDYFGDYDGRYTINDSTVTLDEPNYSEENLHTVSDESLLNEIMRRGMSLLAGGKTYSLVEE